MEPMNFLQIILDNNPQGGRRESLTWARILEIIVTSRHPGDPGILMWPFLEHQKLTLRNSIRGKRSDGTHFLRQFWSRLPRMLFLNVHFWGSKKVENVPNGPFFELSFLTLRNSIRGKGSQNWSKIGPDGGRTEDGRFWWAGGMHIALRAIMSK